MRKKSETCNLLKQFYKLYTVAPGGIYLFMDVFFLFIIVVCLGPLVVNRFADPAASALSVQLNWSGLMQLRFYDYWNCAKLQMWQKWMKWWWKQLHLEQNLFKMLLTLVRWILDPWTSPKLDVIIGHMTSSLISESGAIWLDGGEGIFTW